MDGYLCCACGTLVDNLHDPTVIPHFRTFNPPGAVYAKQLVCAWCMTQKPCSKTFNGVHGEVLDVNDMEEEGWIGYPVPEDLQDAPNHQVGNCRECHAWQVWDASLHCWRDPRPPMDADPLPGA